jgi:hypothetical protein
VEVVGSGASALARLERRRTYALVVCDFARVKFSTLSISTARIVAEAIGYARQGQLEDTRSVRNR